MGSQATSNESPRLFPLTRWSVVLAAARKHSLPESSAALETICHAYWAPLYAYARRCGKTPHDSQDLTQEFFAQLLEKNWLAAADREKGRLRTFLMTAFKNFMSKEWRRACAQKRGGGKSPLELDSLAAGKVDMHQSTSPLAPDQIFDRQWALTLLELSLKRLEEEFTVVGKSEQFNQLKSVLMASQGSIDYANLAAQLGISFGTARVAVHRLRKRFREIFREEISHTISEDSDLEAEMRHLAGALAQQ
jgi:RNA polymerase sigma factor (sigma-70 family)